MSNRYYLINRPDVQPSDFTNQAVWCPTKSIPGTQRYAHGWAEYEQPLAFETIWKFDLLPANANELDNYWNWRDENER